MTYITNVDPHLEIARGNIAGQSKVNKFGRNTSVGTTAEDIWDGGGIWIAPTTARTHDIASDNAADTSAGAGARTIRVFGLTGWGSAEVSEDITMNGTSNVATANSYVIIHRMLVLTKGATDVNVGTITATAQTDATVTAQINPSEGQTQMAIYGIPSTQKGYMTAYYGSVLKSAGTGGLDLTLRVNPEPDAELTNFLVKHTQAVLAAGASYLRHQFMPQFTIDGPAIIKLQGAASTGTFDTSGGFDMILVDN